MFRWESAAVTSREFTPSDRSPSISCWRGWSRLGGVYVLIKLGLGVRGAVLASVIAVIVTYFAALPSPGVTHSALRHRNFISRRPAGYRFLLRPNRNQ